jgi:translation initiation factor IF-2
MSKVRIHALAKDLGVDSKKMLELLHGMGVDAKTASSTIDEETAEIVKALIAEENAPKTETAPSTAKTEKSGAADVSSQAVTQPASSDAAKSADVVAPPAKEIPHRPPVVTIMGHVDHGKTSLLDYIRKTKVAEKEAGGITQHVGAFEAITSGGKVVFIDTPGHEAFTSIRARGAQVADIAVIVIAASESLMPQTREAIAHAKAAKVPIVVAINKIDLPNANVDKVTNDLMQVELVPEAYGGDTIVVPISARTGEGIDKLLENLLLVAELEDLRADPDGEFKGVIIEAKVDKQAGVLATVLIQNGTLKVGEFLVVGELYGKVRAMTDSNGSRLNEAQPGSAVQILGFSETPVAGELVAHAKNEHDAREIISSRKEAREDATRERERGVRRESNFSLESILGKPGQAPEPEKRVVNLIVRADTQGSLEALQGILAKENTDEVQVNVMFAGIGAPTEGDVLLASTAEGALILGFSVTPSGGVKKMADTKKVEIKTYRIIYELVEDVQKMIRGGKEPVFEDRVVGKAEVRMIIRVPKAGGNIAGSYVTEGKIIRNGKARVLRRNKEIWKGGMGSLKRFKDDVREVAQGYECGINLNGFDEFEPGDIIEVSETVEVTANA